MLKLTREQMENVACNLEWYYSGWFEGYTDEEIDEYLSHEWVIVLPHEVEKETCEESFPYSLGYFEEEDGHSYYHEVDVITYSLLRKIFK